MILVRRKYLVRLHQKTCRACILYATKWTQPDPTIAPGLVSIGDEDLQGLMEVIHSVSEEELDLILHSPGGSLEATEALVAYLRSKFRHIRVIVPQLAMSAATMMACAADEIVLGKHSFLGPIAPQLVLSTPMGQRMVSAEDILDQFKRAKRECQEPGKLAAWLPMLNQYGPDLLVKCTHACNMAKALVQEWLEGLMFRDVGDDRERKAKASAIAKRLSAHRCLRSHHRHIPRTELESWGLRIGHLEKDQELQDLVLSVFHATTHTFAGTGAVKIIENHLGKAFITMRQAQAALMLPTPLSRPPGPPRQR